MSLQIFLRFSEMSGMLGTNICKEIYRVYVPSELKKIGGMSLQCSYKLSCQ